jgi:putative chitinase
MTLSLTTSVLDRLWPHAPHSLVDGMAATSEKVFAKYGLTTAAEVADFMAQISEETGGGWNIEEDLNYSAVRLCQVWASRFPTIARALPFAHNPRMLADNVYGSRYGNKPGTDDGYNFRGRSGIQITFRDWYAKIATTTGLDLLNRPDLANDPNFFLECSAAFWKLDGVNGFADRGDFRGETLRVNGGLINFPTRQHWRAIWRPTFGLAAA